MRILRWMVFCLLTMMAFAPHALADVSAEERSKAFAWFDSVGFPAVTKLPLVKVYTGEWREERGLPEERLPPVPAYKFGFLTQSDSKRFSICTLTLQTANFTLTPPSEQHARVYFEPVDLHTYVRSRLKPQSLFDLKNIEFRYTEVYHGGPIELFVLARACEGNGLSDLATQLCNLSETEMKSLRREEAALAFTERIDDLISIDLLRQIVRDYGDPKVTRTAMLSQIDAFVEHFPSSRNLALAIDTQIELKRLAAEDREHAVRSASPNGRMSLKNRIPNLIYDLRDQIGHSAMSSEECDVFRDPREEKSPASQLVKIGLPAVPALLDALTDSRLTRCVDEPTILRVGDVACAVLERIAQRRFENRSDRRWSLIWKEHAASVQSAAREWWRQVQAKGETELLQEGIRQGDWHSIGQAQLLGKQHPEAALSALTVGLKHADSDYVRQSLTRAVGELPLPAAIPLLKQQLRQGQDLGTRVEAARALNIRGDSDGVRAMIQEWRKHPKFDATYECLLNFLVYCGPVEALQVLGENLQDRDVKTRFAIIKAVGHTDEDYSEYGRTLYRVQQAPSKTRQARLETAQHLLVGLLSDTDVCYGETMHVGPRHEEDVKDPRLCDFANYSLAELWPHTYRYHYSDAPMERDHACMETVNRWRSLHGLDSLLPSGQPPIRPVSASIVQPLLREFVHAHSASERQGVERRIVALGLPALSAVQHARQSNGLSALTNDWATLELRLSNTVRSARVEKKSLQPTASFLRKLAALEGHPLTADACKDLVDAAMQALPAYADGIRFSARRENDGTGFAILLTFLPTHQAHDRSQTIVADTEVLVGNQLEGSGAGYLSSEQEWDGIRKAFGSDPDKVVSILIQREYQPDPK